MEKLSEIMKDLEQGKISADNAEEQVLRLFSVSGRSEQLPCEHRSYRAGHSPFVPCICNDCGEEL
jgi:NCAIR mutase (PurE)-related protein